jgi:hypothetical protein
MNAPTSPSPTPARRSYARWVVAGLLLLTAPVVILAAGVWSVVTLSRDAAALRREVMTASGSEWNTRVQLDAGWCILGAARTALRFVHHENIDDARLALASVRHASVGVYERRGPSRNLKGSALLEHTDKEMAKRGWTRLAAVTNARENVLVYSSDADPQGDKLDLCIAVVSERELVVVSTRVDAGNLLKLVERHTPGDLRSKLAKL